MAEVIWTEPAINALDEIADHISLDDYDAACRLVRKVFEKVDLLEENPSLGNIPKTLRSTPYRRLVIKPYRQTADAYLSALASTRGLTLLTIDKGIPGSEGLLR